MAGDVEMNSGPVEVPSSFLPELVRLPVAAKWKELGLQLGVPVHKLDEFQANYHGHPNCSQLCLTDMFVEWVNGNHHKQTTFVVLANALRCLEIAGVGKEILCPAYAPISAFKKDMKFSMVPIWKDIGRELGVPINVLKSISRKHRGYHHIKFDRNQWCFLEILEWYRENNPTAINLEEFLKALHIVGAHKEEKEMKELHGVSNSPAPRSELPECIVRYSEYLREKYLAQPVLPDSDWPPSLGGQFIRLALIPRERGVYANKYDSVVKVQRDYLRGNVDKILAGRNHKKRDTQFEVVLKPHHCVAGKEVPLHVLIDGAPGVGKTTLSRKLSQDWASGVLLQEYDLVLLLRLRDRAISRANSIDEFFYHDDPDLHQSVVRHVRKTSGKHVLLIFDGFDELSTVERSQGSFYMNIIEGMVLSKCSVVVTSRPYASVGLQELASINRHIEVLGFTEEMIRQCIRMTIKDNPKKAEELCTQLHERLDIMSLCYIPLNCAIMLFVYQQENFILPKTLTELYNVFVLHAIKRHVRNHLGETAARRIGGLDKLPKEIAPQFLALCKLAYDSLSKDQLVFHEEDIVQTFPDIGDQDIERQTLALMTVAKSYSKRGREVTCNFLHLTIQEFLAAKWAVTALSTTELANLLKQNLKNDRLRMMLLFVAGIAKDDFPKLDKVFAHHNVALTSYPPDYTFLLLCHFVYESESIEASLHLTIMLKKYAPLVIDLSHNPSGFEYLVLLTFFAQSGQQWDLLRMKCNEQQLRIYRDVCNHSVCVSEVDLEFDGEDSTELMTFLEESSEFSSIKLNVSMWANHFDSSELVTTLLSLADVPNISRLSFLSVVYTKESVTNNPEPTRTLSMANDLTNLQFSALLHFFLQSGYHWDLLSLQCDELSLEAIGDKSHLINSTTSVQEIRIKYDSMEFVRLNHILELLCVPLNARVRITLADWHSNVNPKFITQLLVAFVQTGIPNLSIEFLSVIYKSFNTDSLQRKEIVLCDTLVSPQQFLAVIRYVFQSGYSWNTLKLECSEESLAFVNETYTFDHQNIQIKETNLDYHGGCFVLLRFLQKIPQMQNIGIKITSRHSSEMRFVPMILDSVQNVSKLSTFSTHTDIVLPTRTIPTCSSEYCDCYQVIDAMHSNTNVQELHVMFHYNFLHSFKILLERNTSLLFLEIFVLQPLADLGTCTSDEQILKLIKDLQKPLSVNKTLTTLVILWRRGSVTFQRDPATLKLAITNETNTKNSGMTTSSPTTTCNCSIQ